MKTVLPGRLAATALGLAIVALSFGQDNYEIQVYGSSTVSKGHTMVELHSNYTFLGSTSMVNGMYPTQNALHETIEITHGWNDNFETGFYFFTSQREGQGYQYVGSHIRPRVKVPDSWKWPVGASLSMEVGYQRQQYAPDTWDFEIRPIIDKTWGKFYAAFNPALELALAGPDSSQGYGFSPNVKVSYDATKAVTLGFEYYGGFGPITDFAPRKEQQQQLFAALDLNISEEWEFNAGVGLGWTESTDRLIAKCIVGRRFSF